jgi:hypothetical protein
VTRSGTRSPSCSAIRQCFRAPSRRRTSTTTSSAAGGFELRFRLLDDIGWTKDTHRTSFEVEIDLDEVLEFLAHEREQLLEYIEAETDAVAAYGRVLNRLTPDYETEDEETEAARPAPQNACDGAIRLGVTRRLSLSSSAPLLRTMTTSETLTGR